MIKVTALTLSLLLLLTACSGKSKKTPNKDPRHTPPTNTTAISPENAHIKHEAYILTVYDYEGSQNDLRGITQDRDKVSALFADWGFHVDAHTLPMSFESRMHTYAQTLTPGDVFVFYYSGHGSRTPDTTGNQSDESDGYDELIVLSDSDTNHFILDDHINHLLNAIKARKLIIFDSCNSGTAYKGTFSNYRASEIRQSKYMLVAPKNLPEIEASKSQIAPADTNGTFVYFAACLDEEESLASPKGSLFTSAFIQNITKTKTIQNLQDDTYNALKDSFHPQLSTSDTALKVLDFKTYLKL